MGSEMCIRDSRNSFRSLTPNSDAWIRPNNFWITSTVLGGKLWEIYARVRFLVTNSLPDTAEGVILDRWGNIFDVARNTASKAFGTATFAGTTGDTVPAGTEFTLSNGVSYISTADAEVVAGSVDINLEAIEGGVSGNAIQGTGITIVSTVAGVVSGEVNVISGGFEIETDDDYRVRVIARMRNRNRYGTIKDYEEWALEVDGVTRAWPVNSGGSINVFFMMDRLFPMQRPPLSQAEILFDYLNDECRKPAQVTVNVIRPFTRSLDIDIPCPTATDAQKEIIQSELEGFLIDSVDLGQAVFGSDIQRVLDSIPNLNITLTCGLHFPINSNAIFTSVNINYV